MFNEVMIGAENTWGEATADAYLTSRVKVALFDVGIEGFDPVRVKVTNSEAADQEQGYRLRVQMAPDEGTYKIARLDQVTS